MKERKPDGLDENAIEQRAMRAYFRRFGQEADTPSRFSTEISEVRGRWYVQLSNINGVLATYRIFPSNDGNFRLSFVDGQDYARLGLAGEPTD